MSREFDCLIVGSGFAGSLLGMALVSRGQSVLLVDRQRHPRFAIGESSTPAADYVLESLCDEYHWPTVRPLCRYGTWCEQLPTVQRGIKRGFSYFHHSPGEPFTPGADHARELLVTASSAELVADTHWFRADVDHYLAQQFQLAGGSLREQTTLAALQRGPALSTALHNAWEAVLEGPHGTESVRARFLVDGTGADPLLKSVLGVQSSPTPYRTQSRAIFGHFANVPRWETCLDRWGVPTGDYPFRCDHAAVHQIIDGGWMWQLRFDHGVTSLGFALDPRRWPLDETTRPMDEWQRLLARYPALGEQLQSATPVPPFSDENPLIRTGTMQRGVDRVRGDGWALLPHAAGFIDPFYSTGIAHSLLGVEQLADCLLSPASLQDDCLSRYESRLLGELDSIDRLVALAYRTLGRDPELLHAASMLYFAAVTTWEQRRRNGGRGAFLLADDGEFSRVVEAARQGFPKAGASPPEVDRWCRQIESAVAPWNSVGLFQPAKPRMYTHSAADK